MKKITMRLIALALLTMVSMGAAAKIDVQIAKDGKFDGGTIVVKGQEEQKEGGVKVTITVSPNSGYTIKKEAIEVYATYPPSGSRADTRDIDIASNLTLLYNGSEKEDVKDASEKRDYTFIVPSGFGAWIKEAKFSSGSKGDRSADGYSGVYYIGTVTHSTESTTNNFYLCPTENYYYYQSTSPYYTNVDNGMPFLTTYKCRSTEGYDERKALWVIEKHPSLDCYYIKHAIDGKYLTYNASFLTNKGRVRFHLEESPSNNDYALFFINYYDNTSSYEIISKYASDNNIDPDGNKPRKYLNINKGNQQSLAGTNADGTQAILTGGIIGLWTAGNSESSGSGRFYLESAVSIDPPTITNNFDGTITIAAATGATIYYTTDGSTPTTESYAGTGTTSVNVNQTESMTVIKAIAKAASDYYPTVATTYNLPSCERPSISVSGGNVTITCTTEGATIHYTTDGSHATSSSTVYTGPFAKGSANEIRAIATKVGYVNSNEAALLPPTEVSFSSEITDMNGNYSLASNFSSDVSIGTSENPFSGTIDGNYITFSLSQAFIDVADGAIIKNIIISSANISGSGNAGAIVNTAKGSTRIYNCGVLEGSISGDDNVGGIAGELQGLSRVINCYNYANIESGNNCGGIVGYNRVASTSSNLQTMVMNCMFYGNITGGNAAPIYGGEIIHNKYSNANNTGLNNYCYFLYDEEKVPYVKTIANDKYHGALGAEERFLNRFEFFRMTLNSTRNLAAFYVTGDATQKDEMAKWVLDKSIVPYPILKTQGKYPSVVNPDAAHATAQTDRNKGGLLGTLSVTISGPGSGAVFNAPTGASITNGSIQLNITDKDYDNFNYNYRKVQLPYYNEVGTGNYTNGLVVTGWKITSITGGTPGSFTTDTYDYPSFNYVDRKCTNKDLYGTGGSNRVFAQGAYWEVPDGVESITIEPYWAKAVYLSDANYDVTYSGSTKYGVTVCGSCSTTFNGQTVYTDISTAITNLGRDASHSVYDYAVVLVGNYHQYADGALVNDTKPVTFMSADLDGDDEPDNTLFYYHNQRKRVAPIRFDFLNIPGVGMVKRTHDATMDPEPGIFKPRGWFEITNTVFIRFGQFEYAGGNNGDTKDIMAPLILQGGIYEQFVSCTRANAQKTNYLLIGSNAWFKNFANGCHTAQANTTPKVPINVAGGDYTNFYLTGIYQPNTNENEENAECYIDGGRFTEVAGAGMQQIKGDVTWLINAADITSFFGGGINATKPITGSISTTISNSYVDEFYGGPKFGDMGEGKTVTTNATDCHFGKFFGAGYGGTAFNRVGCEDDSKADNSRGWDSWVTKYYKREYNGGNGGISTNYDYEFILHSDGNQTVARFFVNYASLSLASTRDVTSTLNGCTIGTFYGGGSLGAVNGDVNSTLTNCTVTGSAFGAGFSASVPTVEVWNTGAFLTPKPTYNRTANVFNNANVKTPKDNNQFVVYTWSNTYGTNADPFTDEDGKHYIHTDVSLEGLGSVTGKATLNINGTTTVGKSVYGGGEESGVGDGTDGDGTEVNITSGTIGTEGQGGVEYGNVYGGGKGKIGDKVAGYVKGNTTVNISQASAEEPTTIYHNVYGGGAYGSVGNFTYDPTSGMPTSCAENTGSCTVNIQSGTFGWNGKENGMVFGSSRGDVAALGTDGIDPNDRMAWVYNTQVNIGTDGSATGPAIKGSVYGSGENGHTLENTVLNIYSGTIGIPTGTPVTDNNGTPDDTSDDVDYEGATYPYRGNVYGGGCGTDKYDSDNDGVNDKYNPLAGIVKGTATVNIKGGHVARNVYGAGAMGSVGGGTTTDAGKTTIEVTGGRIGYDGNSNNDGCIFGAARGEFGVSVAGSNLANVRETEVNINFATTPATDNEGKTEQLIAGSVFGGGEAGTVSGSVAVKMTGGLILKDIYGGGALADTQTSNWDASKNENKGDWADGKSSASVTTTVRATGGIVKEEIFGGALGEAGKPAYVWGDVLVDLNGTTTMNTTTGKPMTEGTSITKNKANAKGCAVGRVFGCNNANGTPKGDVMVHVYATQNVNATQIANSAAVEASGENPAVAAVADAKVLGRYDISAVYGGGNEAAYDPVTPYNGTAGAKTQVIIEGCSETSIETVYGGGNAAAVPETNVDIKAAFEIGYLFGGGNGKDKKSDGSDNPGADVGTLDQGANKYGTGNANTLMEGGLIHEALGGSNQKGIIKGTINLTSDPKKPEDHGFLCDLAVEKIVGAGKYADIDGDVNMTLSCQPESKVNQLFAGADEANVNGNITLNITNGYFGDVFGGNNFGGAVKGKITVNVEETGCQPIKIDNLYLGGNKAAYSRFGYYESEDIHPVTLKNILKPRESEDDTHTPVANPATDATHTFPYAQPELNIISCTYIGNVFGGGLGKEAKMYANPTVNVNLEKGLYANDETVGVPKVMTELGLDASENPNRLGIIENVYGGGDQANIEGNTTVNIATEEGKGAYIIGNVFGGGNGVMDNLELGEIIGNTQVTIGKASDNVTLYVKNSVYGGGNIGMVTGNTVVDVNNGVIGTNQKGGYKWGNVYGGGKGKIVETEGQSAQLVMNSIADVDAGLVKGNTTITINGTATTTQILHNVYGGGAVGSVGTFTRDETTGLPTACADNTGLTTVTINGGTIGHDRKDTGMVNGSSRGWEGNPEGSYLNQLAWVNNTNVIIGDASSDAGPSILGSVYGGGENGHNFKNGVVTVNKGTIGYEEGTWDCGNIYGAGCGTDTYTIGESTTEHHNPMAGCVRGTTSITVNGGNILRNVYGGGSMGSVGGGTTADAGKTTIAINGGTIGETNTDYGHVFGGPKGNLSETEFSASVWETQVNINTGADIKGSVFGGGEAGIVKGSVVVNMKGGEVAKDVYGGGALASTNTESGATVVNLTGGHIKSDVYGGGLGQIEVKEDDVIKKPGIAATVGTTTVNLNENVDDGSKGCVVEENIFGCNNQNGTPLGDVTVHIYKTQRNGATRITNTDTDKTAKVKGTKTNGEYDPSSFDIKAVYGGGNLSAYEPTDLENSKANVIIDGCERTSICQVYGGGNAASTPASNVTVNGTFEIGELFGGGNGLDDILINGVTMPNPGANVGYKDYSEYYKDGETWKVRDKEDADTKEKRTGSSYVYGTGKASVNIFGGTIHRVFGGSNTKGNVRQTAVTLLDEAGGCEFCVDEAYGGGKSAEMDAEAQLLMACIPGLQAVYGGAEAADVRGNVTLNITNGTFDRVFGGNNVSGTISGAITINVEEIGCKPVKIGQLYGGGNLAGYSVYGYDSGGQPKETGDRLYDDPQINVMSFTSIGNIYGGGYGNTAVMVGNPTVNVNEVYGKYYNDDVSVVGENAKTPNGYPIPSHAKGKMGAISEIFGGGNAAKVIGNTTVNIGTQSEVYVVKQVTSGATLPDGCYTRNDDGTYDSATGTASADITYYEKKDVLGADIRGNVYGGGNKAEVTGNTEVVIGQRKE